MFAELFWLFGSAPESRNGMESKTFVCSAELKNRALPDNQKFPLPRFELIKALIA
jgi:hypothetical protein